MKLAWLLIVPAVIQCSVARAGARGPEPVTSRAPGGATVAMAQGPSAPAESTPGDDGADNARLAAVLPRGMSSQQACRGLQSLDLCAATLHAAQNLKIPFVELKRQVAAGQGLDAAIHAVKPAADASAEATRATEQAQRDMRAPGS